MVLLVVNFLQDHGLDYLFAATILIGIIQVLAGFAGLARFRRSVSTSVMTGFVNALAILIFMAQLPELIGVSWLTYPMVLVGPSRSANRTHLPSTVLVRSRAATWSSTEAIAAPIEVPVRCVTPCATRLGTSIFTFAKVRTGSTAIRSE